MTLKDLLWRVTDQRQQFGFLTEQDVADLSRLDRLRQVLVRCNGGRFVCAAQDAAHFIDLVESGHDKAGFGDWVRDVSLPTSDPAYRGDWGPVTHDPPAEPQNNNVLRPIGHIEHCGAVEVFVRDNVEYSGAFDGFTVTSDADPGL